MPFGGSTRGRKNQSRLTSATAPQRSNAAAIDSGNADLLRVVTGWWIYGPNGARGIEVEKRASIRCVDCSSCVAVYVEWNSYRNEETGSTICIAYSFGPG